MFKCILVPADGSLLAEKCFAPAIDAAKTNAGKIIGISVGRPYTHPRPTEGSAIPDCRNEYEQETLRLAQQHVRRLADEGQRRGVPCETTAPRPVDPGGEIIAAAQQSGCDVTFIASHGRRGFSEIFLGSEAQRVVADSPIPVLVFR